MRWTPEDDQRPSRHPHWQHLHQKYEEARDNDLTLGVNRGLYHYALGDPAEFFAETMGAYLDPRKRHRLPDDLQLFHQRVLSDFRRRARQLGITADDNDAQWQRPAARAYQLALMAPLDGSKAP